MANTMQRLVSALGAALTLMGSACVAPEQCYDRVEIVQPADDVHEVGVVLHVRPDVANEVESRILDQIDAMNDVYAGAGVEFHLDDVQVEELPTSTAGTRLEDWTHADGRVHVYSFERVTSDIHPTLLASNDYAAAAGRWGCDNVVVMEADAPDTVLSHEVGHIGNLPHVDDPANLMHNAVGSHGCDWVDADQLQRFRGVFSWMTRECIDGR